jgi:pyruvate/2-oxoglutarate/acetoin dehydrogenase E1 component
VVEEGQGFGSVGAEITAQVAERYGAAGLSVARVAAVESPIPAARPLETVCLPGTSHILAAARGLLRKATHG